MSAKYRLGALLFVLFAGTSCDDSFIDPFENEDRFFTVYGFLDVLEVSHAVRVIPVTRHAERITDPADPQAAIDARVVSTDLLSGETVAWTHALERLEDGTFGHVFRARFIVRPGRTYRLEVIRSDGVRTTAETTVPSIPDAALFRLAPPLFSADSTVVTQEIDMPRITSPWAIQAVYLYGGGIVNRRVFVPYGRAGGRTGDGWHLTLNISADQPAVRAAIAEDLAAGRLAEGGPVFLTAMGLQLRVLDQNWDPPEGVFDPEVLAQPGALTNVEHGYGFWGSIGLYIQEWYAGDLSEALGYSLCGANC